MKDKREDWIDAVRGFVIILMIIGHSGEPKLLNKVIFSFHMPFFFILSGMLIDENKYKHYNALEFIKHKFKAYMIPYFLLSGVNLLINLPVEFFNGIQGSNLVRSVISHIGWIFYSWGEKAECLIVHLFGSCRVYF